MRHHFRLVALLAVCLCAYGVMLAAFRLLNQPRDISVVTGLALVFVLLLLVPIAVCTIWRRL